jgi:hypothetical protein
MLRNFLHAARSLLIADHASVKKISCYHCGDKSIPSRTIYVHFDGSMRAVCCNGCAAILKTVEELGMRDEYLAHKIQIPYHHE